MPRVLRSAIVIVAVLGLLVGSLAWLAVATSRRWFENDLSSRAELVMQGASEGMLGHWRGDDRAGLTRILDDLSRDERIMGAAACGADGEKIAVSREFPADYRCKDLIRRFGDVKAARWQAWHGMDALGGGAVELSLVPIRDGDDTVGFVAVVHDMSFADRREALFRRFAWLAFLVLSAAAVGVTIASERWRERSWLAELRELLRRGGGGDERPEFRPLMRDVRELMARLSAERAESGPSTGWDAPRLRAALDRDLPGARVIAVANREPYIHEQDGTGGIQLQHPASGLVTALEPVMRACSGTWIAHGSGSADRLTVDKHDRVAVPPGEKDGYLLRRVWLTPEEEAGYYYGFANEGLWPLCHIAHARPVFRQTDWERYREVNQRFAHAVADEAEVDDPIVLVQDYHFALAPRMIREFLPKATIIAFWHIPWPNAERFGICPRRNELLQGLLGASILGFHTRLHCNNFLDTVDRYLEARIDREQSSVSLWRRETIVRPYPISIAWPSRHAAEAPPVAECRARVREELGVEPQVKLGVGVDRLDYTKGVEERLLAVERMLEREPKLHRQFTFVQIAAPSRTRIERYRRLEERVAATAARINERFAGGGWRPVIFKHEHHEPSSVFRYYRAADVCYVSSLHDGMNLVAKEFIAARDDERGVLVLSEFTGASRELPEALVVNPYDLEQASGALARAIRMPADEQAARMRQMRSMVAQYNVWRWAGRMLIDAGRLRRRESLGDFGGRARVAQAVDAAG